MKVSYDIIVRKFSPKDLSRVMEIEYISFNTDAFSKTIFLSLYNKCSDLFVVAEIDKIIAGYMVTCSYREKAKIVSIAIDPIYRRKCIGSLLANFTFNQLKASSIKTLELEVRTTNYEGICFWKSLGFSTLKIIPGYYTDGIDALIMRKSLLK